MSTIGGRIKARRLALGLTVDQLADRLGKNRATVYRYENDEIGNIPLSVIAPLAEILGTTTQYLAGWANEDDQWVKAFKENVSLVMGQCSYDDLMDAGVDTYLIDDVLDGRKQLTFSDACLIADELGCSLDYLAGIEEFDTREDVELNQLRDIFTSLNPDNRAKLLELSRLYLDAQRKKEQTP